MVNLYLRIDFSLSFSTFYFLPCVLVSDRAFAVRLSITSSTKQCYDADFESENDSNYSLSLKRKKLWSLFKGTESVIH